MTECGKTGWLIAACMIVQTILVVYLVFGQPTPKVDAKLLNVTDAILDLEARIARVEQENAILFRLIRSDRDGVLPDGGTSTDRPFVPLPPSPGGIGRTPGETLGDVPSR